MNAEKLEFADGVFDKVVLNLILSVAENPALVMSEALRVLNDKGKILVFDKFIAPGEKVSFGRKILNHITTFVGTDITRCFEDYIKGKPVKILVDEKSILGGHYRIILLEKRRVSDGKQEIRSCFQGEGVPANGSDYNQG
jgi:ubiquinone/menaquinone biosynthesis C-methylase UbiE